MEQKKRKPPTLSIWDKNKLHEKKKKPKVDFQFVWRKIICKAYDFFLLPVFIYKFPLFVVLVVIYYDNRTKAMAIFSGITGNEFLLRIGCIFSCCAWCAAEYLILLWLKI